MLENTDCSALDAVIFDFNLLSLSQAGDKIQFAKASKNILQKLSHSLLALGTLGIRSDY